MEQKENRYARQMILEGIGAEGQEKLKNARILVAGAGGLGSPVLSYLAAAGVGTLGIADFDTVSLTNLNRQILHHTEDVGRLKVDSAAEKLMKMNPELHIVKHPVKIDLHTVEELVSGYDVVVDCMDNFTGRYLLSDCCYFRKIPIVEGAVSVYDGILMTIVPDKTPCYRCLYPTPPEKGVIPAPGDSGILGATAGVMGTLQALEAVKVVLGLGETVSGRLLVFDALKTDFRRIPWQKRENCPLCGEKPSISENGSRQG